MKKSFFSGVVSLICCVLLSACGEAQESAGASFAAHEVEIDGESDAGVLESRVEPLAEAANFCWKNSYGRGAGSVPDTCPGQQQDGGLCYPWCSAGYYGVGPVCWQACPAGYRDDGTACWLDASIVNANTSQCPWYDACGVTLAKGCSKCPSGYRNDGCTCRRDASMFYKKSYGRGAGQARSCSTSLQSDAGLCYNYCKSGYSGVGPVCWGQCPAQAPVQCGAGCAVSSAACAEKVISQINATLDMASNIATAVISFGASSTAKYLTKVAMTQAQRAALKQKVKDEIKRKAYEIAEDELDRLANAAVTAAQGEPVDWNALDPTGIATMVDAFNAPLCSTLSN